MASGEPYLTILLQFHYTHGFGALAPFFDALKEQRALGTQCTRCGRCWYPPRHTCPHDFATTAWFNVARRGVVQHVTSGPGLIPLTSFSDVLIWALIRLDGCSNAMLARVVSPWDEVHAGTRVALIGHDDEPAHPAQCAIFAPVSG